VPEKNSIAPFVYNHGGKRGAYALMADGSVRFLSADISDKVFQALVTRAGGDDAGTLDAIAPIVP
jgi:prepilin-type processing-associated H-X9-DG protein